MLGNLYKKLFKGKESSSHSRSGDDIDVPTIMASGRAVAVPTVVPEWQPGDLIMERYKVESVLSGAMGRVYICDHLGWGIKMAIKSPRPEVLADREGMQRIIKEANGWIRMGMHPNIAACYYVLAVDRIPHLFIEYVDGGSLLEWIRAGRCRDLRTSLSLAVQFCHGMEYTHKQGIIHRDIKPANILVTKNALLKITDFGILLKTSDRDSTGKAAPLPTDVADENNSTIGFRGTPGFASPEQFENTHSVDHRTDIFSFGLCLWLMFCGKKPYAKNNIKQAIPEPVAAVVGQTLPPSLIRVLKKSVAYAVEDRYGDFVELRHDLNQAYQEAFRVMCPYAELINIDLRASSLNNHAVSFFELNKAAKAEKCLDRALDIDDVLPEALYNMILLKWRQQISSPVHLLGQLEAIQKRLPKEKLFEALIEGVKDDVVNGGGKRITEGDYPRFRLCVPRKSLEVFRDGQLLQSVQRNIVDHLDNKRYGACLEVLQTAWKNHNFSRDKVFNRVYEALLKVGKQDKLISAQRLMTLRGGKRPVTCLTYIPGSSYVVAGGLDGKLLVWDFVKRRKVNALGTKGVPIRTLAASPRGGILGIGADNGVVTIWSTKTGKVKSSDKRHEGSVRALAFSVDGKWIASGGEDGILKLRRLATGKEISISIADSGAVCSLAFCGEGNDLITGSEDGTLRFWEGGGKEYRHRAEAHAMPVVALSVSPDGRRFASTSADRLVKVWEYHSSRCLRIIEAHDESVSSVLMLADNRHVVSGCDDDIIKLWDIETGRCAVVLDGRGDGICSLAPGPKPHIFLAGRCDGAVVFWMNIYQLTCN